MKKKKYRTGVVLSGGGARGFAHLSVLQALNDSGIFPAVVSGTSAGAHVGVLYADGYRPEEILQIMNSSSMVHIAERSSILNMAKEVELKASRFEIFIAPDELRKYKILDLQKAIEVYNIGYKETKNKLEEPEMQKFILERLA